MIKKNYLQVNKEKKVYINLNLADIQERQKTNLKIVIVNYACYENLRFQFLDSSMSKNFLLSNSNKAEHRNYHEDRWLPFNDSLQDREYLLTESFIYSPCISFFLTFELVLKANEQLCLSLSKKCNNMLYKMAAQAKPSVQQTN